MTTALAIFVKTPGHSPVKTRLAETIGTRAAVRFHRLAAQAVAEVACAARGADEVLQPCWAVAERAAVDDPLWQGLPRLWQGNGGLGQRLHCVYDALLAKHQGVLLVGADAPQLTPRLLHQAVTALADPMAPFVLGEASDGGFWLFGSRFPITGKLWDGIGYSRADTCEQLRNALRPFGNIVELPELTDVDRAADMLTLAQALATLPSPMPTQRVLAHWLERLTGKELKRVP